MLLARMTGTIVHIPTTALVDRAQIYLIQGREILRLREQNMSLARKIIYWNQEEEKKKNGRVYCYIGGTTINSRAKHDGVDFFNSLCNQQWFSNEFVYYNHTAAGGRSGNIKSWSRPMN